MATRSTGSVLFLTAIACASMIACSVTSTETPPGGTKSGTSLSSSSSSSGSTTSSSSSGGGEESQAPTTCAAKTGYDACMDCCSGGKPDAVKAGATAFTTCLCGASGVCKTECATDLCSTDADAQESQACADCLQAKGQPCIDAADTACEADATCKAASACAEAAKCEDKE